MGKPRCTRTTFSHTMLAADSCLPTAARQGVPLPTLDGGFEPQAICQAAVTALYRLDIRQARPLSMACTWTPYQVPGWIVSQLYSSHMYQSLCQMFQRRGLSTIVSESLEPVLYVNAHWMVLLAGIAKIFHRCTCIQSKEFRRDIFPCSS